MDLKQITVRKLKELIVFTILILVALWNYDIVMDILEVVWEIIVPFALGGAIAFVINVPMSFLEKKLFGAKETRSGKKAKLARPLSLVLTLVLVLAVIVLVMFVLIPQLADTIVSLATSISLFLPKLESWVRDFTNNNAEVMAVVSQIEFDSEKIISWAMGFLGTGAENVMTTTMSALGRIVSALTTFFIAFSFACYVLFQKEKLHVQSRKVMFAFLKKRRGEVVQEVCSLAYKTFSSFLTGQCVEALILGSMFVVTLTILKLPYALLIGIIIAFTALIPVFGAFIGCGVGAFLIFMVSPKQALLFIVVFLVLQQIEGNFIYPHVVGGSVGLPSIWVLAAVSIGGNLIGVIGMLIFIPIASVAYALFREFIYLKLKQQGIKNVTVNDVEEYSAEEMEHMKKVFLAEHAGDEN